MQDRLAKVAFARNQHRQKKDTKQVFERIKEDMRTILERDPAALGPMQVIFSYPGLHALAFHRAAHWCWIQGWYGFARWLSHVCLLYTSPSPRD